jgi:hypothetical protein
MASFAAFSAVRISLLFYPNRDSSFGIVTGYGLDGRGVRVRVPVGSRIFLSPSGPDRLWDTNAYRGALPRGKVTGA